MAALTKSIAESIGVSDSPAGLSENEEIVVYLVEPGSGSWVVPPGVNSIKVETVGAGASGGPGCWFQPDSASNYAGNGEDGEDTTFGTITTNGGDLGKGGQGGGFYHYGEGGNGGDGDTDGEDGSDAAESNNSPGASGGRSGSRNISGLSDYGDGSDGGQGTNGFQGGGGGGGGAYDVVTSYAVTPGQEIAYTVGAGGRRDRWNAIPSANEPTDAGGGGAIRITYVPGVGETVDISVTEGVDVRLPLKVGLEEVEVLLTTPGAGTWTVPEDIEDGTIRVEVVGAGGSGGSDGSGAGLDGHDGIDTTFDGLTATAGDGAQGGDGNTGNAAAGSSTLPTNVSGEVGEVGQGHSPARGGVGGRSGARDVTGLSAYGDGSDGTLHDGTTGGGGGGGGGYGRKDNHAVTAGAVLNYVVGAGGARPTQVTAPRPLAGGNGAIRLTYTRRTVEAVTVTEALTVGRNRTKAGAEAASIAEVASAVRVKHQDGAETASITEEITLQEFGTWSPSRISIGDDGAVNLNTVGAGITYYPSSASNRPPGSHHDGIVWTYDDDSQIAGWGSGASERAYRSSKTGSWSSTIPAGLIVTDTRQPRGTPPRLVRFNAADMPGPINQVNAEVSWAILYEPEAGKQRVAQCFYACGYWDRDTSVIKPLSWSESVSVAEALATQKVLPDGIWYLLDNDGDELWKGDADSPGSFTVVGNLPPWATLLRAMAWHLGKVYAADSAGEELIDVNLTDPAQSVLKGTFPAALTHIAGMTSHRGRLIAVDSQSGATDFWDIDVDNPSASVRLGSGPAWASSPSALASLHGFLYATDWTGEYGRINLDDPSDVSGIYGNLGALPPGLVTPKGMGGDFLANYIADDANDKMWKGGDTPGSFVEIGAFPSGIGVPTGLTFFPILTEHVAVDDSVAIGRGRSRPESESISISEAVLVELRDIVLDGEAVAVTDALALRPALARSESISISDAVHAARLLHVNSSESISIAEAHGKALDIALSFPETLGVTETGDHLWIDGPDAHAVSDSETISVLDKVLASNAPLWPPDVPTDFLRDSFRMAPARGTVPFEVDQGAPLRRRQFTKSILLFSGAIPMTPAEWEAFKTFYKATLDGGRKPFLFVKPLSDPAERVETQFVTAPRRRRHRNKWAIAVSMRTV